MLAAVCGRDEGPVAAGAGEHDVPRFVAHEQGCDNLRGALRQVDDADAVGQMIHDPDLVVVARCNCDGLHADRDRVRVGQASARHRKHLEPVVRGVDCEQLGSVGRQDDRSHRTALELDERRCRCAAPGQHSNDQKHRGNRNDSKIETETKTRNHEGIPLPFGQRIGPSPPGRGERKFDAPQERTCERFRTEFVFRWKRFSLVGKLFS